MDLQTKNQDLDIIKKYLDLIYYTNNLDVELNLQKVFIRLAYKYKYISLKNYETWSNLITEICNMLGGWIKQCQKR